MDLHRHSFVEAIKVVLYMVDLPMANLVDNITEAWNKVICRLTAPTMDLHRHSFV